MVDTCVVFFFKKKTAYEMRISDWSSDVCSSDLLDLLLGDIGARLNDMGFTGPGGRQLVLCGGGAELKGIADFAQGVLGRSVRVGRPRGLVGLPEAQSTAAFSTLAGIALFAGSGNVDITRIGMQGNAAPRSLGNALLGKRSEEHRLNFSH